MIGTGVSSGSRGLHAFFICWQHVESFLHLDDSFNVIETRIRAVPETNPMIAVRGLLVSNQCKLQKVVTQEKTPFELRLAFWSPRGPTDQPCQRFSPRWPIGRMVGVITKRCSDWTESRFNPHFFGMLKAFSLLILRSYECSSHLTH